MIRTIALTIFANIFITANALNIDSLNIRIYTEEANTYNVKEEAKKFYEIRKSANFAKFVNNINDGDTLYLSDSFFKEHPEENSSLGCINENYQTSFKVDFNQINIDISNSIILYQLDRDEINFFKRVKKTEEDDIDTILNDKVGFVLLFIIPIKENKFEKIKVKAMIMNDFPGEVPHCINP